MKVKGTQRRCVVRRSAADAFDFDPPPVPVGKRWTDQPLAGHARDRVATAAAQDVPSVEPVQ
ncbi:MAG: hypothetical protein WAV67_01160, partial [Dokdonella sp.]